MEKTAEIGPAEVTPQNTSPNAANGSDAGEQSQRPARWRAVLRITARVLLVLVCAALMVLGVVWWQERPLRQAEAALRADDPKYAEYLLGTFLSKRPDHPRALALKARTSVEFGNGREAIEIYEQIGTATTADMHALAKAYLLEQRWSMAVPMLEQVLRLEPLNADALHELTVATTRRGEYSRALISAERMARLRGSEARGWLLVGTIRGDMQNFAAAAEAFQQVLKFDAEAKDLQVAPHEFFRQYGHVLLQLGRTDEAIEQLKRSVATRENAQAFFLLGNAALQKGWDDKARSAWLKAILLEPNHRESREALANLALEKADAKAALGWLGPLQNTADLSGTTAYLFQRCYALLGDKTTADLWKQRADAIRQKEERLAAINYSVLEQPDSYWSRVIQAHRFASSGNWGEAERMVEQLRKEAPQETYVKELAEAIQRRSSLPSLDGIPIKSF